jgi:hypothetical protein
MRTRISLSASAILITAAMSLPTVPLAAAESMPTREGACAWTKISRLEHRLQDGTNGKFIGDSGSAVVFANGAYQVSYEELIAIHKSKAGDRVLMCLVHIPRDCPAGDARALLHHYQHAHAGIVDPA